MQTELVENHTSCDVLKNRQTRISRGLNYPEASAVGARGMLPMATRGDAIGKETVCLFNPKSQACTSPYAGNEVLKQVRNVRGITTQHQLQTFRSVERATMNRTVRTNMLNNAKCVQLARESAMPLPPPKPT